jgi:3-oxoacyl-[acyl-carrier-protein] synthase II
VNEGRQVWITGIGLLSSIGEGNGVHGRQLLDPSEGAKVDEGRYSPYPVHPLVQVNFGNQIPKKSDQRQMEGWQCIGVYAAGLALEDAGVAGNAELLDVTNLVIAAGNGDRDCELDQRILETMGSQPEPGAYLNQALLAGLRPTLYLGELSNLLAGNISIIHKATGSSRTFKGEEIAGVSAVENAYRRIAADQGDLFLVGGALNAEREDLLLGYELGRNLWAKPFRSVWQRQDEGGGLVPGSVGAFLVLEAREHAEGRNRTPYARLSRLVSDRSRRSAGDVTATLTRLVKKLAGDFGGPPIPVLSGASGVEPITSEERSLLECLSRAGFVGGVRAYGSRLGHAVEAHFPLGVALAALALQQGQFYPPFDATGVEQPFKGSLERILVTGLGHWRGEGLALLEKAV